MTLLGALGGFFIKKSSNQNNSLIDAFSKLDIWVGFFLYGLSAVINIYILKYLPYSIVLPMTSITYIWTIIISYKFLNERITKMKVVGIALIIIGMLIISLL